MQGRRLATNAGHNEGTVESQAVTQTKKSPAPQVELYSFGR
jgi:hypothetical protein